MSVLGESEAFFLFFLCVCVCVGGGGGGFLFSAGCANFWGNPGPIFLGKFSNLGALHEIFSVESKSFQQVLSKVATF